MQNDDSLSFDTVIFGRLELNYLCYVIKCLCGSKTLNICPDAMEEPLETILTRFHPSVLVTVCTLRYT